MQTTNKCVDNTKMYQKNWMLDFQWPLELLQQKNKQKAKGQVRDQDVSYQIFLMQILHLWSLSNLKNDKLEGLLRIIQWS